FEDAQSPSRPPKVVPPRGTGDDTDVPMCSRRLLSRPAAVIALGGYPLRAVDRRHRAGALRSCPTTHHTGVTGRRPTPRRSRRRAMTPFMTRVAEFIGAHDPQDVGTHELPAISSRSTTMPQTRISRRVATGTGADRHVALRSLAEQYVCEANAVLGADRDHLDLVDEAIP